MKKKYIAPEVKSVLLDAQVLDGIAVCTANNWLAIGKQNSGWDDSGRDDWDDESDGLW